MKNWQKIALSVLTVGVTATTIYFGVTAIKKKMAEKKKKEDGDKPVPKVDVKKDIPPRKAQLIATIQDKLKKGKLDAFNGVTDGDFNKLSEPELDKMNSLLDKFTKTGETAFSKQYPKDYATLTGLAKKVLQK